MSADKELERPQTEQSRRASQIPRRPSARRFASNGSSDLPMLEPVGRRSIQKPRPSLPATAGQKRFSVRQDGGTAFQEERVERRRRSKSGDTLRKVVRAKTVNDAFTSAGLEAKADNFVNARVSIFGGPFATPPMITADKPAPAPALLPPGIGTKGSLFFVEELAALPIFKDCSEELLPRLSEHMHEQSFHPGHVIFEEGLPGCSLLLVMRGTINLFVDGLKVQHFEKGHYFGETILLGIETNWKGTLKAETACTICEVNREEFWQNLEHFPQDKRYFEMIRRKHKSVDYMWAGTLEYTIDLFRGLSERLRRRLDDQMVRRLYFPGQRILEQDQPGDEMYMLVHGRASIDIGGRVAHSVRRDSEPALLGKDSAPSSPTEKNRASIMDNDKVDKSEKSGGDDSKDGVQAVEASVDCPPICFGELGLLGMQQVRSATIAAESVCQLRVLYRNVFLRSLEEHGESLQSMTEFFEKRYNHAMKTNSAKLKEVSIFKEVGCSEDFLDFLAQHLEDRMYLEGMRIIDENLPDDRCMYLISSGSVKVIKAGQTVATLDAGAVVGEITVLGLASKRSSTIVAAETTHTQVLHQKLVVRGLELFPEERQKILLMAFKKGGMADGDDEKDGKKLCPTSITHRAFLKVLQASPLFSSAGSGFVDEISKAAVDRIYMPGDLIIVQGSQGDSMFIMVSGTAGVYVQDVEHVGAGKDDSQDPDNPAAEDEVSKIEKGSVDWRMMSRVGTLHAGSITGELAMLGVLLVRSATIEAETICSMWEITQERALSILDRFPDAQKKFSDLIVKHLERTVPGRMQSLPLLKNFDRKFRTLLGLYCDREVFFPGQVIVREGQAGNDMYVINIGKASLEKKGVAIKTLTSGNHFGSTIMLGIHKCYIGTLLVMQTCHVLSISRISYVLALDHYPSTNAANQLKTTEKKITEDLRETIQKIASRKFIWRRFQGMISPESQDASDKVMTESEMIQRVFMNWRKTAQERKKARAAREAERQQYRNMMEVWVKKKRQALVQIKNRQDMEEQRLDAICPFRQRAAEEKRDWEPSRRGRKPVKALPPVAPAISAATPDSAALVGLLKEWPTPRPSPFYKLKVWNVIAESLDTPGDSMLLPLLTGPPNTAATQPDTSGEPLCASPPGIYTVLDEKGVTAFNRPTPPLETTIKEMDALSEVRESVAGDSSIEIAEILAHSYTDDVLHEDSGGRNGPPGNLGSILDDICLEEADNITSVTEQVLQELSQDFDEIQMPDGRRKSCVIMHRRESPDQLQSQLLAGRSKSVGPGNARKSLGNMSRLLEQHAQASRGEILAEMQKPLSPKVQAQQRRRSSVG